MRKASKSSAKSHIDEGMAEKFFRKGTVGDWKNYFTGEKKEEWDEWIAEQLKGTDIDMSFELKSSSHL